jgi:hypothetical protein
MREFAKRHHRVLGLLLLVVLLLVATRAIPLW